MLEEDMYVNDIFLNGNNNASVKRRVTENMEIPSKNNGKYFSASFLSDAHCKCTDTNAVVENFADDGSLTLFDEDYQRELHSGYYSPRIC